MSESVLPPKLYASSSPKMPAKSLQKIHMVVLLHILWLGCKGSLRSVCSKFFQNADSFLVSLFFSQVFAMSFYDSVLWISLVAVPTLAALAQHHLEIAAFPWRNVMNITSFNCCTVACM